jgi:acylphosphatase
MSDTIQGTFVVTGRVQGVGLRWWICSRALDLGLVGHARNAADGSVEVAAQGERAAVEQLRAELAEQPSSRRRPGWVESVSDIVWGEPRHDVSGFLAR